MATFLLATNTPANGESLCAYLAPRLGPDDVVVAVNSQRGGDDSNAETIRLGVDALDVVEETLGDVATLRTHQYVRGNDPAEDVLAAAEELDPDELVVGVRKRNPTAKVVFGSVAQKILLNADRPIAVVPQETV